MVLIAGVLCLFVVLFASLARNLNVPLIIIALGIGILFGSDVTGIIYFDDALLSQEIANIALVFILFAGGYGTKRSSLKPIVKPTLLLATLGVLLTAVVSAFLFQQITGWTFLQALLVCAIISSTDAAAVFSILRTRTINSRVAPMTEIESAANDPMAIISTTFIIQLILGDGFDKLESIGMFTWQLIGGLLIGVLIGKVGIRLFQRIRELEVGYFYILLIGVILVSYGLATLMEASGMLSAFFAGFIFGNSSFAYKKGISSFTETLSFIANVGLFILLGLLAFPRHFADVWVYGVALFLIITFIGRPLTVFLCTLMGGYSFKEKVFLSWSGLRGAVPIVLATYPAAAGIDQDHQIFNIVFFAVTLSIIVQGTTIGRLADYFKMSVKGKKKSQQTMELVTVHDTNYELIELYIDEELYSGECRISELALPTGTTITMIARNNSVIAPSGNTVIRPGDILSLLIDTDRVTEVTDSVLGKFTSKL